MSTQEKIVLFWFRDDLRLHDHPALYEAAKQGFPVLGLYIDEPEIPPLQRRGGASAWWLHHALHDLQQRTQGGLHFFQGTAQAVFEELLAAYDVQAIYWTRAYDPWRVQCDTVLKGWLKSQGCNVNSIPGTLLWEPWDVLKKDRTPYRVFTPFFRKGCLSARPVHEPVGPLQDISWCTDARGLSLDDLQLLPSIPWDSGLQQRWQVSEEAAHQTWQTFLAQGLQGYRQGRDFPAQTHVSGLSPYLRFGMISVHRLWHDVHAHPLYEKAHQDADHFLSELAWREFSYHLLYHYPHLLTQNMQTHFDAFPWQEDPDLLKKWQTGCTGYPLVDAGMRQLWQEGTMHNRVRMVVASFLVKNLLIDWRAGAAWFWDCLVDADIANNTLSWQWVAGCGADAAPYFRIFNPITQAEKFDPEGLYIRRYVPELAALPLKYLWDPQQAPKEVLQKAGVHLGETYPYPCVQVADSRARALEAYAHIRQQHASDGS